MSRNLYIAKSGAETAPTLPLEAVTSTFAFLGQRGTGKTSGAVVLVEEMAKAGGHAAVFDPVGVWWGITREGEKQGVPGIVIGGEHADVPLEETGGQLVAELIVGRYWPVVVVDMKMLRKGAQLRFMADCLEAIFHLNREPLHVVFEEADRAMPQQARSMDVNAMRVLGAGEDIVKLGRSRGLGASLVTQRPATLNKNVLEQVETLMILRLLGPNDRKAIKTWIEANGDIAVTAKVMESLPSLGQGEAWMYSPGFLGLLKRIRFRMRRTFDSSATPKVGERVAEPTKRAPVDLDALRSRMAETVERAKQNDPAELRKTIAQLQRDLVAAQEDQSEREVEVEVVVPDREAVAELSQVVSSMDALLAEVADGVRDSTAQVAALREYAAEAGALTTEAKALLDRVGGMPPRSRVQPGPHGARVDQHERAVKQAAATAPAAPAPLPSSNGSSSAGGPAQRILNALAWLATVGIAPATRLQVAMVAGYHPRTKGFTNALGSMRTEGLVDYPDSGYVALTEAGRAQAQQPEAPLTSAALQEMIYRQVGNAKARILQEVVAVYPDSISRADLADRLGYHERTKGFTNGLGALRSLGLIEYPRSGMVEALPLLFVG